MGKFRAPAPAPGKTRLRGPAPAPAPGPWLILWILSVPRKIGPLIGVSNLKGFTVLSL